MNQSYYICKPFAIVVKFTKIAIMTDKARIEKIIQTSGMADGQFAQEIGIQNSTLSHILNGRNRPSLDVIKKILNRFPEIDSDWLIFGHGSMLRKISQATSPNLFDNLDQTALQSDNYPLMSGDISSDDDASNERKTLRSTPEPPYHRTPPTNQSINQQSKPQDDNQAVQDSNHASALHHSHPQTADKKITKIILYFSDHTFQEFDSK